MNWLVFWGSCGILLMLTTTLYGALYKRARAGQSVWGSVMEAWTNITIGFSINFIANILIFPLAGYEVPDASTNFWMGCTYTGISVFRLLIIRRLFNYYEVLRRSV